MIEHRLPVGVLLPRDVDCLPHIARDRNPSTTTAAILWGVGGEGKMADDPRLK